LSSRQNTVADNVLLPQVVINPVLLRIQLRQEGHLPNLHIAIP